MLYSRGSRFISNFHSCFWKCNIIEAVDLFQICTVAFGNAICTVEAVDLFQICTVAFGNAKVNLFPVFSLLFPTIRSEFWLLKSTKHLL